MAAILDSAEHAIIGTNRAGLVVDWNKNSEKLFRYDAQEACGKSLSILFPSDRVQEPKHLTASLSNGEIVREHETVLRAKDGRTVAVSLTAVSIRGVDGAVIGAWFTLRDLTERNRTREELSFQCALLSAQQESCPDGILVVDDGGKIISWNRRFVELWGLEAAVIAKRSDEAALQAVLYKLADPESFLALVKHLYEHREEKSLDQLALTDGRVLERYTSPIFGDAGRYYGRVWYFRDVTALRFAQEQVRLKTDELQRSNEELELFSSIASHDLQAPLRKISSFGQLLREKYEDVIDDAGRAYLRKIQKAAEGMSALIQALLQLARIKSSPETFQSVNLKDAVRDVLAVLEYELKKSGARVEVGPLPSVHGDPVQIRALLQNLIANALKFVRPDMPPRISLREVKRPGETVEIEVEDNGIGIGREELGALFKPFQRLHPEAYEGSGMGLAICHRIVLRHRGSISVTSSPGKGSIFRIMLPAARKAEPASAVVGDGKEGRCVDTEIG